MLNRWKRLLALLASVAVLFPLCTAASAAPGEQAEPRELTEADYAAADAIFASLPSADGTNGGAAGAADFDKLSGEYHRGIHYPLADSVTAHNSVLPVVKQGADALLALTEEYRNKVFLYLLLTVPDSEAEALTERARAQSRQKTDINGGAEPYQLFERIHVARNEVGKVRHGERHPLCGECRRLTAHSICESAQNIRVAVGNIGTRGRVYEHIVYQSFVACTEG